MNRLATLLIAVAIVALAAVAISMALGGDDDVTTDSNSQNNSTNTTSQNNNPVPVTADEVKIANMAFSPADITVKTGTTVTWTNDDTVAHDVTGDSTDGPESQTLEPGESYSFTFSKPGTYSYHCSIHPNMQGSVTVTE